MKRICYKLTQLLISVLIPLLIVACGGGESGSESSDTVAPLTSSCDDTTAYVPAMNPVVIPAVTDSATSTVIVLHDKLSTPLGENLQIFLHDLSAANLNVVAPYMPWSTASWTGSACEGLTYVAQLAAAEAEKGRSVVVAGHKMGATLALRYAATGSLKSIKAVISIAPDHLLHLDGALQHDIVKSMALAQQMMDNGMANIPALFDTRSNGESVQVAATPRVYWSYHALDEFPDIRQVASLLNVPVLWLAGSQDPRTVTFNFAGLASKITSVKSRYQVLSGDHETLLNDASGPIGVWLGGMGL